MEQELCIFSQIQTYQRVPSLLNWCATHNGMASERTWAVWVIVSAQTVQLLRHALLLNSILYREFWWVYTDSASWIIEVLLTAVLKKGLHLPPSSATKLSCPDQVVGECVKKFAYSLLGSKRQSLYLLRRCKGHKCFFTSNFGHLVNAKCSN